MGDLSPLVLSYRKALGAIRDEETELRVAAAIKQLAERASESWVEWARGDWPELATAIDAEVERRVEEQKRLAEEEARRVDRRQAPLGPDTPLFGNHIPPGTSTQSHNSSISPSTLFDIFDGARRLLEARHGRPDASRVDLGTSSAFGEQ
ncbi:predicted protein [Postia placenta Mad-698-R]|nr:predicted protein [Postia placenta Mad-698-R]